MDVNYDLLLFTMIVGKKGNRQWVNTSITLSDDDNCITKIGTVYCMDDKQTILIKIWLWGGIKIGSNSIMSRYSSFNMIQLYKNIIHQPLSAGSRWRSDKCVMGMHIN